MYAFNPVPAYIQFHALRFFFLVFIGLLFYVVFSGIRGMRK